eukprot:SAG31_NODE_13454_length_868_cov_1.110533_1_plen_70_part_10
MGNYRCTPLASAANFGGSGGCWDADGNPIDDKVAAGVVGALSATAPAACMMPDQDGRLPLHLACRFAPPV